MVRLSTLAFSIAVARAAETCDGEPSSLLQTAAVNRHIQAGGDQGGDLPGGDPGGGQGQSGYGKSASSEVLLQGRLGGNQGGHSPGGDPGGGQGPSGHGKSASSEVLLQKMKAMAGSLKGLSNIDDNTAEGLRAALDMATAVIQEAPPAITRQHDDNVAEVNAAQDAVDHCSDNAAGGQAFVDGLGSAVQAARERHGGCRGTETEMENTQTTMCGDFTNFINGLPDMSCMYNGRDNQENVVSTINTVGNFIETYQAQANQKMETCHAARAELESQHGICTTAQTSFEEQYCAHRTSCASLAGCREREEATFHQIMDAVADSVDARKIEYRTIKQIECFLGAIESAVQTEAPVGDAEMSRCAEDVATDHLDIAVPVLGPLLGCEDSVTARAPCDAAFFNAEYASFEQRAAVEAACNACPGNINVGGPAVEPAPAPTSVGWNSPCTSATGSLDGTPVCTVSSNDGNSNPWILFGDINSRNNNFVEADWSSSPTTSGLHADNSLQVGTFSKGSIGSPGYSLDIGQFAQLSTGDFDLMIQYGDNQVFSHAESGYSKTDGQFINNGYTAQGAVIGEHGMWGSRDDHPNGNYASFCAYHGGCRSNGFDFWGFSTSGVLPTSAASVVCGFWYGGWDSCPSGDNGNRMRYYIRAAGLPVSNLAD